jgi:hypothetical protein
MPGRLPSPFPPVLSRLLERLFHLATIPAIIRDWDVGISNGPLGILSCMRRSDASVFTRHVRLTVSLFHLEASNDMQERMFHKCMELDDFVRNAIDQTKLQYQHFFI